jgi:16S rRNA (adenine1518-N6/adenine1519-N6)-dimethyltransferase
METIKPIKRFGQNYLIDQNIIRKIIKEISPQEDDNLIEIGPGTGALTGEILKKNSQITTIEIDKRVNKILLQKFPELNLVGGDFLNFDLRKNFEKKERKLRITGNIPYNLTSSIIFKLIDNNEIIEDAILMVQYEVAKRMTAKTSTKDYGISAVLIQYFCNIKFCFKISPNVFYPKPKVYSAIVHLFFKKNVLSGEKKKLFIKIVKASFGNRRKTLKNSLSNSIFKGLNFENCGIDISLRAEQLDIHEFLSLTDFAFNKPDF